jgi:hypothetical protein
VASSRFTSSQDLTRSHTPRVTRLPACPTPAAPAGAAKTPWEANVEQAEDLEKERRHPTQLVPGCPLARSCGACFLNTSSSTTPIVPLSVPRLMMRSRRQCSCFQQNWCDKFNRADGRTDLRGKSTAKRITATASKTRPKQKQTGPQCKQEGLSFIRPPQASEEQHIDITAYN